MVFSNIIIFNCPVMGVCLALCLGYELTSAGGSVCEDSDECLEPNICGQHQKCTNSIGSFDFRVLEIFIRSIE